MPRISSFTESEDRIILRHAHQPADAVNAALVAAGFVERSAQQLSQRRYYLRRRRPVAKVARSGGNSIIALEAERHDVMREIIAIDKQRAKLENRLREVTDALLDHVSRVESDVVRLRRDPTAPLDGQRHASGTVEPPGAASGVTAPARTDPAVDDAAQTQGDADVRSA
jgi:hypothetical protein